VISYYLSVDRFWAYCIKIDVNPWDDLELEPAEEYIQYMPRRRWGWSMAESVSSVNLKAK
jgi:hypothetical protein